MYGPVGFIKAFVSSLPEAVPALMFTSPVPDAMILPAPSGAMVIVNAPADSAAFAVCGRTSVEMVTAAQESAAA
jgi:hypothetical protein